MRPVQYFTDEYLEQCKKMTPTQIAEFIDSFQRVYFASKLEKDPSVLISIKIPKSLLDGFKTRASLEGSKYQTKIKELMKQWVLK